MSIAFQRWSEPRDTLPKAWHKWDSVVLCNLQNHNRLGFWYSIFGETQAICGLCQALQARFALLFQGCIYLFQFDFSLSQNSRNACTRIHHSFWDRSQALFLAYLLYIAILIRYRMLFNPSFYSIFLATTKWWVT